MSSEESTTTTKNDAEILRNTFLVYGSFFLVVFFVFCAVRLIFPRPFTVRRWSDRPELKSPLANNQYGFLSWIWRLHMEITEDEILDYCGLDALCFLRTLGMGYKLCKVGIFNAIWLMPLYYTAVPPTDAYVPDPVSRITVAHVQPGSDRLLATVLATYTFMWYAMYLILQEFDWFIEKRHKFLRKRRPSNYSVYVSNIPGEFRSNARLEEYFRHCLAGDPVLEARLRVKTSELVKVVNRRATIIDNFEAAMVMEQRRGYTPKHRKGGIFGERVDSIETYAEEIRDLNREITKRIENIERKVAGKVSKSRSLLSHMLKGNIKRATEILPGAKQLGGVITNVRASRINFMPIKNVSGRRKSVYMANDEEIPRPFRGRQRMDDSRASSSVSMLTDDPSLKPNMQKGGAARRASFIGDAPSFITKGAKEGANMTMNMIADAPALLQDKAADLANTAMTMVTGVVDEGDYYDGGFVSFKSLTATNAARQLVHNNFPFRMRVVAAPEPKDVFWTNVGIPHKELLIGRMISLASTTVFCFFWALPTASMSTLSSVDTLEQQFDWVADLIDKYPFATPFLELLAPLLIIVINSIILPRVLKLFSMFEGPVSRSAAEASSFTKQSIFMIIVTFFVSLLTGGVLKGIQGIMNDPLATINILAQTLPTQSTYFMQIAFIRTVIYVAKDNLRLSALTAALLRQCIGPRTTKKQRQTSFWGLRPLADPVEFEFGFTMSQICVLFFVILFVYQAIAPLVVFILAFCFQLTRTAYLHQLIYIHPSTIDSGGRIWISFITILLYSMLIAELTTLGLMGLNQSKIATPLIVPLIVQTLLFNAYISQRHFRVAEGLATRDCIKADFQNSSFDLSFVKGAYLQDELRVKEAFPQDLPERRADTLGLLPTTSSIVEEVDPPVVMKSLDDDDSEEGGWAILRKRFVNNS